jgi:hypothetical protein
MTKATIEIQPKTIEKPLFVTMNSGNLPIHLPALQHFTIAPDQLHTAQPHPRNATKQQQTATLPTQKEITVENSSEHNTTPSIMSRLTLYSSLNLSQPNHLTLLSSKLPIAQTNNSKDNHPLHLNNNKNSQPQHNSFQHATHTLTLENQ